MRSLVGRGSRSVRGPLAALGLAAIVVGAAACPSTSSSGSASATEPFGPLVVGDRAAVVDLDLSLEGSGWTDRTVTVAVDEVDGAVVIELVDDRGRRRAAAVRDAADPSALTLREDCDADGCSEAMRLRVARVDEAGPPVAVAGSVRLEGTSYGSAGSQTASIRVGDPAVGVGPSLAAAPSPLEIDGSRRIAGDHLVVEGVDCDDEPPWLLVPPSSSGRAGAPQLRVITAGGEVSVPSGWASPLPDGACEEGAITAWVVLAAPLRDRSVRASWIVVGGDVVARARASRAEVRTTASPSVELHSAPVALPPVQLPPADASLHLVEGEALDSLAITGGGPDWVEVALADPDDGFARELGRELEGSGFARWAGTGYAPLVIGPCVEASCPGRVELRLRSNLPGGPPDGEAAPARATVTHLLVGA
jgi:hypothetical protein